MPLSGPLTKAHIVEAVVETDGYTQQKAHEILEILLEFIKRTPEFGEDVLISGFGKFCVKSKKTKGQEPDHRKSCNYSIQKSRYIQMVRETERKSEYKTGNKGKEKTCQEITNSASNGSDVLMFDTMSTKNLNHV